MATSGSNNANTSVRTMADRYNKIIEDNKSVVKRSKWKRDGSLKDVNVKRIKAELLRNSKAERSPNTDNSNSKSLKTIRKQNDPERQKVKERLKNGVSRTNYEPRDIDNAGDLHRETFSKQTESGQTQLPTLLQKDNETKDLEELPIKAKWEGRMTTEEPDRHKSKELLPKALFEKSKNKEPELEYRLVPFDEALVPFDEASEKIDLKWSKKTGEGRKWKFESNTGSIKIAKIAKLSDGNVREIIKNDIRIGTLVHNPKNNILAPYKYLEKVEDIVLISDFAENGNLYNFSEKMRAAGISEELKRAIALTVIRDMANGIVHIQKHDVVHKDLKPSKVEIDADGRFQIISFGEAGKINQPYPAVIGGKTDDEPESFRPSLLDLTLFKVYIEARPEKAEDFKEIRPTAKTDVYGIGRTVYQFLTGKSPSAILKENTPKDYDGDEGDFMREKLAKLSVFPASHGVRTSDKDTMGLVPSLGNELVDSLFNVLLAPNPDNRIAAQDIGNHEAMKYLQNGEESAVGSKEIRDLIIAIASGKQRAIDEKSRAFEAKFVPKERAQGNEITYA